MSRAENTREPGPDGPPRQARLSPRSGRSARLVVIARIALLFLVAGGAVAGLVLGRRPTRGVAPGAALYFCPMHREIGLPEPGSCPVCGMALLRRELVRNPTVASELAPYEVRVVRLHKVAEPIRVPARVDAGGVVVALFHRDEVAALAPDERGAFVAASAPGAVVAVAVPVLRRAEPPRRWDDDTVEISFAPDGAPAGLVAGLAGWINFVSRTRELIAVPEGAVLRSGEGPYVLVASASDRLFTERAIEIGRVYFGNVVVTAGLTAGERIVTRKAFFLDAERRLRNPAAAAVEVRP